MDLAELFKYIDGGVALVVAIWFFNKMYKQQREDFKTLSAEKEALIKRINDKDDVIMNLVNGLRDEAVENQKIFAEMTEVLNSIISKGEKSEDKILQAIAEQTREVKKHVSFRIAALARKKIDLKDLMNEDGNEEFD